MDKKGVNAKGWGKGVKTAAGAISRAGGEEKDGGMLVGAIPPVGGVVWFVVRSSRRLR